MSADATSGPRGATASRTLIAYDGSPSASSLIERTAALLPGAEAIVCAVADRLDALDGSAAYAALPDDVVATASARLRDAALQEAQRTAEEGAAAARALGLRATALVEAADGPAHWALLEVVAREEVALVACGSHGRGALARALLGSVSSGIVQRAAVPVLVVPAGCTAQDGPLLAGWDGSAEAGRALQECARWFGGADVVIAHVWESPLRHTLSARALQAMPLDDVREVIHALDEDLTARHAQTAEAGAERARALGLRPRVRGVESGERPSEVLLALAEEEQSRLIAVGRRGRGSLSAALLGSVSAALTHAGERPVLIVP
jgi:nucleotide-binding universal stress UspA family protein